MINNKLNLYLRIVIPSPTFNFIIHCTDSLNLNSASYNKKGMDGQVSMFDLGSENNEEENNLNEIKYNFM